MLETSETLPSRAFTKGRLHTHAKGECFPWRAPRRGPSPVLLQDVHVASEHSIWHSVEQSDTYSSPSNSSNLLINMMGIHPVTWSWLALLEKTLQPAASPLLHLELPELIWQSPSEGESSTDKMGLVGSCLSAGCGWAECRPALVSLHLWASSKSVHEMDEQENCRHKHKQVRSFLNMISIHLEARNG